MDLSQVVDHYLGIEFLEEFFDLTHILREKIKTKKLTCEWESIKLQLERHLLNKVSFNQICSIFHQFILSLKKSHQLDIFITIFCITDEVYDHIKDSCFPSVVNEIRRELRAIILYHIERKFENLRNILTLLEFHSERAI